MLKEVNRPKPLLPGKSLDIPRLVRRQVSIKSTLSEFLEGEVFSGEYGT